MAAFIGVAAAVRLLRAPGVATNQTGYRERAAQAPLGGTDRRPARHRLRTMAHGGPLWNLDAGELYRNRASRRYAISRQPAGTRSRAAAGRDSAVEGRWRRAFRRQRADPLEGRSASGGRAGCLQ